MDPTITSLRREIDRLRFKARLQMIAILLVGAPWLLAATDPESLDLETRVKALEKGINVDKEGNVKVRGRLDVTGHPKINEPVLQVEGKPHNDGVQSTLLIGRPGQREYIQFIVQDGTGRNIEFKRAYDGHSQHLRFNSDRWVSD